ncbi:hypothetical protein V8C44DRAFT_293824 [Trichoderma aethiopicum]
MCWSGLPLADEFSSHYSRYREGLPSFRLPAQGVVQGLEWAARSGQRDTCSLGATEVRLSHQVRPLQYKTSPVHPSFVQLHFALLHHHFFSSSFSISFFFSIPLSPDL